MMVSVEKLSNFMLLTVHRVCGTEETMDAHPHPVTNEELTEIVRRVDALMTPEGMHEFLTGGKPQADTVTVNGEGKNRTRTRTGRGVKL